MAAGATGATVGSGGSGAEVPPIAQGPTRQGGGTQTRREEPAVHLGGTIYIYKNQLEIITHNPGNLENVFLRKEFCVCRVIS